MTRKGRTAHELENRKRGEEDFLTILDLMDRSDLSASTLEPTPATSWQTHLKAGDASAALQRYRNSETPDGEVLEALGALNEVRLYMRAKGWAKAQRALTRVETPPRSVAEAANWDEVKAQLSVLESTSKLLDKHEAHAALERLESVNAPLLLAEVETQRGTAHIFLNDSERARLSFTRALGHDPKHYRALTNKGNLSLEENNVDEAIQAYEAALRLNEDFANAHHNLGVAYRRKGKIDKSVRSIRRAQKAMRRQDAEEAKGTLSQSFAGLNGRLGGRGLRYALYGLGALLLLWWLRSQGML